MDNLTEKEKLDLEKAKLTPVVQSEVKRRNSSIGRKFAETFLSSNVNDVKEYVVGDVLIPSIKDGLYDIFTGALSMLFYNSSNARRPGNSTSSRKGSNINYTGFSSKPSRPKPASRYDFSDIIFATRSDAQETLDSMLGILERYSMVTVHDYYELAGESATYTDQNYGWTELDNVSIMRDYEGYKLRLPKAIPLK